MTATLNWLDVSAEQQRRVRELIRLFEEPGTRDEIGVGQVRDAFSDLLFPGTSTVQTRARYFLFVPWHFQEAQRRGSTGQKLLQRVDASERRLIVHFKEAGDTRGLIGSRAGARVKILPSTIYWSGLLRLGILNGPLSHADVAGMARHSQAGESDEMTDRSVGAWRPGMPSPPDGFPDKPIGGFDLTADEARWLRELISVNASGTLFAHLVNAAELSDSDFAWEQPSIANAADAVRETLDHARRFSVVMHGAALVYNLLVARRYDASGFTRIASQVEHYLGEIDRWGTELREDASRLRNDLPDFWLAVAEGNGRVAPLARAFVEQWVGLVAGADPAAAALGETGQRLVESRVRQLRGGRSVLVNDKLLAAWPGASGAGQLDYRWGTVRTIIRDIHEGLSRAAA